MQNPGTYPYANLPTGGPPPIAPMPGPATLGPGTTQGSMGTGVAGVGINPVSAVTPPAATGGPHPLPALPAVPLPQGFPNPFELQQAGNGPANSPGPEPLSPGTTTVIGPQGYLPGLGYFGAPGQGGQQPGLPGLPGLQAGLGQAMPPGFPLQAPPRPQPQPQAQPQPQPQPQAAGPNRSQNSPFWIALAWQLVNTPAARSAVGERLTRLMEGSDRMRTIQVATSLLLSPEMQNAFRALSTGAMQQTPFTALFADRLRGALDGARLGQVG